MWGIGRRMRLIGLAIVIAVVGGLAGTPTAGVQAAAPVQQSTPPPITPFSGTATLTYTSLDHQVPNKASRDVSHSEQTETFTVRDAGHWLIQRQVTAPIFDSGTTTFVANGNDVVAYSSIFNRAVRMPAGVTDSGRLLSELLQEQGMPVGTSAARLIALAKGSPGTTARSLGQATVAGQQADVVQIAPVVRSSTSSCDSTGKCTIKNTAYGFARYWIDHAHGIVLRYQEYNVPKKTGFTQGVRYQVTSISFGQGPSDAQLAYTPPVPVEDLPQNSGGSTSSGGGPNARFQAPPGFISISNPTFNGVKMTLQGSSNGQEWLSSGPTFVEGLFGGSQSGFVYVKERTRASGLPEGLMSGAPQSAGSCQVWTGQFTDGLRWLSMARGQIAVLAVSDKLTQAQLVQYAARGICTAPIVPQPSAQQVEDEALDHLETEIDITRQILGWTIASAPTAADKSTLKGFDARLEAFDRAVFAIRHPQAVYSGPSFPPPQKHPFKQNVEALKGEMGAAKPTLQQAEAAVQSPADRQTLEQQGKVFDELIQAVDAMVAG